MRALESLPPGWIAAREGGTIELLEGAAGALGVLPSAKGQRSLVVRTDNPPVITTTQIGHTSISRLQIGAFEATLPDTNGPAGHDQLTILMQTRGTTTFENKNHSGASTPGQIVIFDSNAETAISSLGKSARIVASISKSALPAPILQRLDHVLHIVEPEPGLPRIFAHFLRAACRDAAALGSADRTRLDRALLYSVADLIETCGEPLRTKGAGSRAHLRAAALHLIETDINGLVSIADLAERLNCSERYLHLAFQEIGTTPGRYTQSTRLKRARIAIESSSDLTITEIAYAAGFQSYSHFSRSFKNMFGITPKMANLHKYY